MDQRALKELIRSIEEEIAGDNWRPAADHLSANLSLDLSDDERDELVGAIHWHAQTYDDAHARMINVYKLEVSGKALWIAVNCSDGGVAFAFDGPAKSFKALTGVMKLRGNWTYM